MVPLGVGVAFLGYTAGMWGFCLVRGYNVTLRDLFRASWPGGNTQPSGGGSSPAAPGGLQGLLQAAPPPRAPSLQDRAGG